MDDTVDVTIPLDPAVAARLADPVVLAQAAALVNRTFRPANVESLFAAIAACKAEARANGLTDAMIDEELAAYNAERRTRGGAD
ncbi:MAG: hypothetical protein ACOYOH_16340 [Paracraurococcus sp.]